MTQDEILSAAKEAGCNDEFIKMAPCWLKAFAKIIERKTIERCAEVCEEFSNSHYDERMITGINLAEAIRSGIWKDYLK